MPFKIIRNDITKVKADVIVNTANPRPMIGRGTDCAVYAAAGAQELLAEREKIGPIARGQAAATPAFALNAKYIIHTVGPSWKGGYCGEREILRECYRNSLALAIELEAQSIAFPLIASGNYGFPRDEALDIALEEFRRFLRSHELDIIMVVFDRQSFELSKELVGQIDDYIDEHSIEQVKHSEYSDDRYDPGRTNTVPFHSAVSAGKKAQSLEEVLSGAGDSFRDKLFQLIRQSGMDDVTVYKRANLDRKLFSRIRNYPNYRPNKRTAVALAVALELDLPAMQDLLARAEIAMSPSSKFDLIIGYFVSHGNYDIFEINAALFQYDQPILGLDE